MPPQDRSSEPIGPFFVLTACVAALTIVYAAVLIAHIPDPQERGFFGDMFGALNTAFSGLAFAALAYTLNLQRKELALQRQELAETRAVLAEQAKAQAEQAETALRAAEISALGSLYQSYAQLVAAGNPVLIARTDWRSEVDRVRNRLHELLAAPKSNASGGR
jgi:hypothetical protein